MVNIILVVILLGIVAGIVWYLLRAKKRGETCIGCPYAKQCASQAGKHAGGCHCRGSQDKENENR